MICCWVFAGTGLLARFTWKFTCQVDFLTRCQSQNSSGSSHVNRSGVTSDGSKALLTGLFFSRITDFWKRVDINLNILLDWASMRATILATRMEPEAASPLSSACYYWIVCSCHTSWVFLSGVMAPALKSSYWGFQCFERSQSVATNH
jgi:hypothetical protein